MSEFAHSHSIEPLRLNACYIGSGQQISSVLVVMILVGTYIAFYRDFQRFLIAADEAQQTVSDYSIVVNDPPFDAHDAEEWVELHTRLNGGVPVAPDAQLPYYFEQAASCAILINSSQF